MIERNIYFKRFLKIFIFFPVIFYFGNRSFIAYDEGFYALQARWILEKGNWIVPLWWDNYVLDRTIGIQFLIAKSQEIFGKNIFWAYLPTTFSAIVMLFITYKLHEELLDKKYAIISPLILSTTYIWFDYSHLATQDIIYSCLVTIGVFSLVKIKNKKNNLYIFLFGFWIGLAFMMKTFLVAVPLISLLPYIFIKRNLLASKFLWIGLLIGFAPFILWTYSINSYLDQNIIFYLFDKLNNLSNKNNFTNPPYYYLWNIPVTFLPWSIFSFIGLISNILGNKNFKFILSYFPLFLILIISLFSTKTPYYPLQISAVLSLNSYIGIKYLYDSKKYKLIFTFVISKIIPLLTFSLITLYYFFFMSLGNFNVKENIHIILGLTLFAISWSFVTNKNSNKKLLIPLILGPYLLTTSMLQSGLFTDRSRELRETMEQLSSFNILKEQIIKVDLSGIKNSKSHSKIIRISLLTPHLGNAVNSIDNLNSAEFAWSTKPKEIKGKNNSYEIIYENINLNPWILIRKK